MMKVFSNHWNVFKLQIFNSKDKGFSELFLDLLIVSCVSLGSQADQSSASVSKSQDSDWSPLTYGGGKLKRKVKI